MDGSTYGKATVLHAAEARPPATSCRLFNEGSKDLRDAKTLSSYPVSATAIVLDESDGSSPSQVP